MEIGSRLKDLRNSRNMTQKDLADVLFVTPQAISKWESDLSEPSLDMLDKIATHFGVSVEYLMGKATSSVKVEESVKPVVPVTTQKPVLTICEKCNRPIYEASEIVRHSYKTGRTHRHKYVYCKQCDDQIKKVQHEYAMEQGRKRRVRSFWWSGIISLIVLAVGLGVTIPSGVTKDILIALGVGILMFPFIGCLFLKNNFVGEMVISIFEFSFIRFPSLIFTLDLDGIIWFLTIKLVFGLISILIGVFFAICGISLGLIVSAFVYPFALRKNILHPEEVEI